MMSEMITEIVERRQITSEDGADADYLFRLQVRDGERVLAAEDCYISLHHRDLTTAQVQEMVDRRKAVLEQRARNLAAVDIEAIV